MPKRKTSINLRQQKILKAVVERYIVKTDSISSLVLAKSKDFSEWSSATIRNDMVVLEDLGYLKKEYFSSGKIPTKLGYKFYIECLMEGFKPNDQKVKSKLIEIFSDRHSSVDQMIDKCAKFISEFLNLPTVLIQKKNVGKESLRKIDIVNIEENQYIIYMVTSLGEIFKDLIVISDDDFQKKEDLMASIRLLNEELSNCQIDEIKNRLNSVVPVLKKKIHRFEFVYESIISQMIINNLLNKNTPISKVYNTKSIVSQPEIQRKQINLEDIFDLLENYSTFSPINYNFLKTGHTLINLENKVEGLSVATTTINLNLTTHQLSVIGPIRMNYSLIKYLFDFLNEKLKLSVRETEE